MNNKGVKRRTMVLGSVSWALASGLEYGGGWIRRWWAQVRSRAGIWLAGWAERNMQGKQPIRTRRVKQTMQRLRNAVRDLPQEGGHGGQQTMTAACYDLSHGGPRRGRLLPVARCGRRAKRQGRLGDGSCRGNGLTPVQRRQGQKYSWRWRAGALTGRVPVALAGPGAGRRHGKKKAAGRWPLAAAGCCWLLATGPRAGWSSSSAAAMADSCSSRASQTRRAERRSSRRVSGIRNQESE